MTRSRNPHGEPRRERRHAIQVAGWTLWSVLFGGTIGGLAAEPVDYVRDVQPIFRKHCLDCHGPDEQESSLRLDRRASLLRGGDLGEAAIQPGKGAASFLVKVVSGKAADVRMPPEGDRLSEREVATIRKWIDEGAKMPAALSGEETTPVDHWSFRPVSTVRPPRTSNHPVRNPIDAFVARTLETRGLSFSPIAERRTRIRRLSLVMHGIPPTPRQIERFLADTAPDAWERLVDEVLAGPRYGERWARHWLDLVRFGETHGFETNRERPNAWPYRDFVIRSFNDDKPYDQFVREQVAGDALGAPVGTGFLVGGPYDLVKGGGNLAAMQRMNELDDIINTTGTTFLGLTLGCARCHNHKFDPVTQRDYYAVQAVFAGVQHGDRALPVPPIDQRRIAALEGEIAELTTKLSRFRPDASGTANVTKRVPVNPRLNTETFVPQRVKYVRFTIEKTNQSQPCLDELEIFSGRRNVALASGGARATASGSLPGYEIHKLVHVNDGRYGNSRSWIADKPTGWVQIELPEVTAIDRIVWARDREGRYKDRLAIQYRIEGAIEPGMWKPLATSRDRVPFAAASKPPATPTYDFTAAPPKEAAAGRQWLARLEAATRERSALQKSSTAYVGRFTQPGTTHRLHRGEPDQPREVVEPNTVAFLGRLELQSDAAERDRRAALADWIVADDNPLTARVIVNRLWQQHFGTGLIDTPSDFGTNGSRPTHPELLDWLARELVAHDWSLKHVHRLILTSHTWQQDSRPRERAVALDGDARLLWRFPPRRLEAEAIRDSLLAVSGVLDDRMGGPGFSGFDVSRENVRHYFPKTIYDAGDWRRMIYMTKVRQEQESVFGAFDCPDASQVAPKRSRSTTPLQAFNLLNSPFVLQQCDLFAKRLTRLEPRNESRRAAIAIEWAFGRPATVEQAERAREFATRYGWPALARALFNANEFVFIP